MPEAKAKAKAKAAAVPPPPPVSGGRRSRSRSTGTVLPAKSRTESSSKEPPAPVCASPAKSKEDAGLGLSAEEARSRPAGSSLALVRKWRSARQAEESSEEGEGASSEGVCSTCAPESPELETCPICLDHLNGEELGVCLGTDGRRSCLHYFHLSCLRRVEGANCPQCRVRFYKRAPLPRIQDDCQAWGALIAPAGDGIGRRAVSAALKAMLLLTADDVDAFVERSWDDWARGEEYLSASSLPALAAAVQKFMPTSSSRVPKVQEDSGRLEDGHKRTGVVCDCGQIHVRRGDRVRRGPAGAENMDVPPGQLGTIVRIGKGQETVTVKWDRCDETQSYIWPDPDGNFLEPVLYTEVAEDVRTVQEHTNLSSAAAEEWLRLRGFELPESFALETCVEGVLRQEPKRWHRVRILPDSILVQQWYDSVAPCQCNRPGCSGGVRWSSHADKHLGREGLVLQIDNSDDTVLVETSGPCTCQIWYPRLAVLPVYDPDLENKPCHKVGDQVECKMEHGWERGTVEEVLWNGKERTGRHPYGVKLHDGKQITVPHESLIRKSG